jgi:hypothetical protein
MWRKIIALGLALMLPTVASGGPLKEAAERAGRALSLTQSSTETRSRGRFWTGIALIAAGSALALSGVEFGDDEDGLDDGEDDDDSDDAEDSDGWGDNAKLGGGIAAAVVGGILVVTGRNTSGPVVSLRRGGITFRHSIRF